MSDPDLPAAVLAERYAPSKWWTDSRCTNPHVDGCPNCVVNTEEPIHLARLADGCDTAYHCADCGHVWSTAWGCA